MRRMLGIVGLGLLVACLPFAGVSAVPGDMCPELSTGRVQPIPGTTAASVPAPQGMLIDQYCVVTQATMGATSIGLDPMTDMVSVETTDGSNILEYSVSFVAVPAGEQEEPIAVIVPPAPATIGQESMTDVQPEAVLAGGGASVPSVPPAAWIGLLGGLVALTASLVRRTSPGQRMSGHR